MDDRDDISRLSRLKKRANRLPLLPGVYIMKNKNDEIIYIGKAKALKTALRSISAAARGTPQRCAKWSPMSITLNILCATASLKRLFSKTRL